MTFAEKDSVIAQFFGAFCASMNFIDLLYAAVKTMQAELEGHVLVHSRRHLGEWVVIVLDKFYRLNATKPQPVAQG
jgi:hypothetical protein